MAAVLTSYTHTDKDVPKLTSPHLTGLYLPFKERHLWLFFTEPSSTDEQEGPTLSIYQQNKSYLLLKKKLLLVCRLQRKGKRICEAEISLCGQTTKLWQRCWAPKGFIGLEWVSPAGLLLFTAQVLWAIQLTVYLVCLCFSSHLTTDAVLEMEAHIFCCHVVTTSSCWFSLCVFDLTWTVSFALTNTKCFACCNHITCTSLQHP